MKKLLISLLLVVAIVGLSSAGSISEKMCRSEYNIYKSCHKIASWTAPISCENFAYAYINSLVNEMKKPPSTTVQRLCISLCKLGCLDVKLGKFLSYYEFHQLVCEARR